MASSLVVDIETNSLDPYKATRIHCIVTKDVDTGEVKHYKEPKELPHGLLTADKLIGHNFISYDYVVLDKHFPNIIDPLKIVDTLVLSRLLKYRLDDGQGHSIEAWGSRFNLPKLQPPDFSFVTDYMIEYCTRDVEVNYKLYLYLKEHLGPEHYKAIETEMAMAWVCLDMHENGFRYDKANADILRDKLVQRLLRLDTEILQSFPPRVCPIRVIEPRLTKHGTISKANLPRDWTDLTLLHAGCPFTLVRFTEFNPGSYDQCVERLDAAGWRPTVRTKSGQSFKLNEENLATLPDTAPKGAKLLVERMLIASRVRTLTEWEEAYNKDDGRIHGKFNSIGTWTGRMSHRNPNMGNIAAHKTIKYRGDHLKQLATDLGAVMRSLWLSSDDAWLVGTDAEGIQLRIFAHYINDPLFTLAVTQGKKNLGTDPHSLNARVLGCTRDTAKTFIYAFLLGAGDAKIGEILGVDRDEGRSSKGRFIRAYPGLARLREDTIPKDATRGYFEAFDGRLVPCNDEHLMLAGYLQNGEACIMKHANIKWRKEFGQQGLSYKQVNFVHDEWQTEVYGSRMLAETGGRIQAESIRATGESFNLRCPMAGQFVIGKNWLETH